MEVLLLLIILFISSLVRTTFGFADALIAMPLLAMTIGIDNATPLVAFISTIIAISIIIKNPKAVKLEHIGKILLYTIIGIPIGVIYFKTLDDSIIKLFLAIVIFLFAAYKLYKPHLFYLKNEKFAFFFGLLAGILGGAYNTNGPPVIIYGSLRRWPPEQFREILQGILLPVNITIVISHGIGGLWTNEVFKYFLISLPAVILAIIAGTLIHKKINRDKFNIYVYWLLIIISVVLFYNSILNFEFH